MHQFSKYQMLVEEQSEKNSFFFTQQLQSFYFQLSQSGQNEDGYLEQFLDKDALTQKKIGRKAPQQTLNKISQTQYSRQKIDRNILLRKKSKFHNYQKHLIITLRKHIKIQEHINEDTIPAVLQLWELFQSSKSYNKSLLRILFGQHQIEQSINLKLFKKEGFKKIIERYHQNEVIQAQHNLRKIVLSNLQENELDNLLINRKLPNQAKELFKKYIEEFLLQLRQGKLLKRLPKSRKQLIMPKM